MVGEQRIKTGTNKLNIWQFADAVLQVRFQSVYNGNALVFHLSVLALGIDGYNKSTFNFSRIKLVRA